MAEFPNLTKNEIKKIKSLHSKKGRLQERLFIVEGSKQCQELLHSDFVTHSVIVTGDHNPSISALIGLCQKKNIDIYELGESAFASVCDAQTPQGIIAVAELKESKIDYGKCFIALDNVNDPGNLGTLIRTADWFGFSQLLLSEDCADIYNPKTVRSSMGSLFHINIIHDLKLADEISKFKQTEIFGAYPDAGTSLESCIPKANFGLILGSESHGISPDLSSLIKNKFGIAGSGKAESLNVASAGAVSMYHFSRFVR